MFSKEPRIHLPRWRKAIKGMPCVGCAGMICDPETTVPAHIKIKGVTNHGTGCKPDDMWIAALGMHCHQALDSNEEFVSDRSKLRLVFRTWRGLYELGVLR